VTYRLLYSLRTAAKSLDVADGSVL